MILVCIISLERSFGLKAPLSSVIQLCTVESLQNSDSSSLALYLEIVIYFQFFVSCKNHLCGYKRLPSCVFAVVVDVSSISSFELNRIL